MLMLEEDHAVSVYGPAARELILHGARLPRSCSMPCAGPDHYKGVVEDVRRHLVTHYSYDRLSASWSARCGIEVAFWRTAGAG